MENYLKETNVRLYQKPALPSNASCVEWGERERQKQKEKEKGVQKGLCVCEKDVYFSLPGSQALEDLSLSDNERPSLMQPLLFNVAHMGCCITCVNWNNFHHTDPKWHNLPCLKLELTTVHQRESKGSSLKTDTSCGCLWGHVLYAEEGI